MGANQWRTADAWPPAAHSTAYYLGGISQGERVGSLSARQPSANEQFTTFVSDPADPVRNRYSSSGAHDYRDLVKRADVLTFDTEPVNVDTEVTGPIHARVFFACDCRDTDVWVRLLDVAPDGTAFNLMSPGLDVQRASYREPGKRQLLTPDHIYELNLDHLITSNAFLKGHRIRVQIFSSFFPNFSRNPQTGELENTSAKMQKANLRIYHDAEHPSQIVLPVIAP